MRRLQPVEQVIKDLVTKVTLGSQLQGHCFDPWRRGKWAALPAESSLLENRSWKVGRGGEEPSSGSWAGPRLVKPNAGLCLAVKGL